MVQIPTSTEDHIVSRGRDIVERSIALPILPHVKQYGFGKNGPVVEDILPHHWDAVVPNGQLNQVHFKVLEHLHHFGHVVQSHPLPNRPGVFPAF